MTKEELQEIVQLVIQAKEMAGETVKMALFMPGNEEQVAEILFDGRTETDIH